MTDSPELAAGEGYFLYHSIGMFPEKASLVAAALAAVSALWARPDDGQWPASLRIRQQFLEKWRGIINAPAGTLTTADNVTTALYSLMGSLPDRYLKGRCVLVAADCFPSLHFLLAGMAERRGFRLHTVPLRPGETWVRDQDVIQAWTPDVGVALLTLVTSTASHRCDVRSLVAHGRAMGSLIGVDVTQGVGIVPFDTMASNVDFVVSTTLKWLCGVSGAGVLQVRAELLRECTPELRGWFSQENPFCWDLDAFAYAGDARRFDHGTPSILPFAACIPALEWHERQQGGDLVAHNRRLVEAIIDAAKDLRLTIVTPRDAERRGGSIMLQLPQSIVLSQVVNALRAAGVHADCRGTTLRLSPGNVTTMLGVERCIRVLHDILGYSK